MKNNFTDIQILNSRWWTTAILIIAVSLYFSDISSDIDGFLYCETD